MILFLYNDLQKRKCSLEILILIIQHEEEKRL